MKTFIKETTHLKRDIIPGLDFGWGNGYVILDNNHPWYEKDYEYINKFVNIHGGLTFSAKITKDMVLTWGLEIEDLDKWMIGFDTAHLYDSLLRWSKDAVQREADKLLEQCKEYK